MAAVAVGRRATRAHTQPRSYVNPALWAGGHPGIAQTYHQTAMARSASGRSPPNAFDEGAPEPTYFHRPSQSYFTMVRRDGKYYQRRYQTGFDGKPANILEKEIHYVIGSGNQVRSYLHHTQR